MKYPGMNGLHHPDSQQRPTEGEGGEIGVSVRERTQVCRVVYVLVLQVEIICEIFHFYANEMI